MFYKMAFCALRPIIEQFHCSISQGHIFPAGPTSLTWSRGAGFPRHIHIAKRDSYRYAPCVSAQGTLSPFDFPDKLFHFCGILFESYGAAVGPCGVGVGATVCAEGIHSQESIIYIFR